MKLTRSDWVSPKGLSDEDRLQRVIDSTAYGMEFIQLMQTAECMLRLYQDSKLSKHGWQSKYRAAGRETLVQLAEALQAFQKYHDTIGTTAPDAYRRIFGKEFTANTKKIKNK